MSLQRIEHALKGMPELAVKIVMEVYRSDERMFEDAQLWVERYLAEPEFKALAFRLRTLIFRASDLMLRLTNEDLTAAAGQRHLDHTGRVIIGRLEDDMDTYAVTTWGEEWYEKFQERPDVYECDTSLEEGYLLWVELRSEALIIFADLLALILRRVELIYGHGSQLSQILGAFVAGRAARYEAGVLKTDTNKFVEQRTALNYIVSYAISPPGIKDDKADHDRLRQELYEIIRLAVRVSGLRFATSYQPSLGVLEEEASQAWFNHHTPTKVMERFNWIEEASKGGGARKEPLFKLNLTYVKELGLKEGEFVTGRFPSPYLQVTDDSWRTALNKNEMFPNDILSGEIELTPVNPDNLFLISKNKQSPLDITVASRGSGKTTLENATGTWCIDRGYLIFRPTMPRVQDILTFLPLLPLTDNLTQDCERLEELRIKPRGMPCRFVTIYENSEDIRYNDPWTVHDVKIRVKDLSNFRLDWSKLFQGMKKGYVMFRDLATKPRTANMRGTLINGFFDDYRRNDRSLPLKWQNDEVQTIYGATFSSPEDARLVRISQEKMNDVRGYGLPTEFFTRSPAMLQPDVMESPTSWIFSDVRESGADETRSSRQRLFKAIRSRMPETEQRFLPTVERIMTNVNLHDLHLFFRLDHHQRLSMIRATLPPHMIEDDEADPRTIMQAYEKTSNEKVLTTWERVPELDIALQPRIAEAESDVPVFGLGE